MQGLSNRDQGSERPRRRIGAAEEHGAQLSIGEETLESLRLKLPGAVSSDVDVAGADPEDVVDKLGSTGAGEGDVIVGAHKGGADRRQDLRERRPGKDLAHVDLMGLRDRLAEHRRRGAGHGQRADVASRTAHDVRGRDAPLLIAQVQPLRARGAGAIRPCGLGQEAV